MNPTAPPAGNLYLVVGYDGLTSRPPGARRRGHLAHGRPGSIAVVYVAHRPSIDMLSPGAVAEMETDFDEIARELHTTASEQLRDREERWRFERREGLIPDELIAVATDIHDAHPGDNVVIVVGAPRMPCTGWSARSPSASPGARRCPWWSCRSRSSRRRRRGVSGVPIVA